MTAKPPSCKRFRLGWNYQQILEGLFRVFTPKHTEHFVDIDLGQCDCIGYNMNGTCSHLEFVRWIQEKESRPKRTQPRFRLITRKGEVGV